MRVHLPARTHTPLSEIALKIQDGPWDVGRAFGDVRTRRYYKRRPYIRERCCTARAMDVKCPGLSTLLKEGP